jgi:hypothetical protein
MKTSDISLSIIIILIFIALYVFNILVVGIKKIQNDWPTYRCNPVVMPMASVFGHDPMQNFTYCIQTMQSNYMGYLMQPLHYNFGVLGKTAETLTNSINSVRAFFNNLRNFITDIIQNVFGVFLNILIEFQRLTINIKDMFGKTVGILATLMYTLNGSIMTMTSAWAGPPGQMVRALCFHPDTKLQLKDGTYIEMKNIQLNSVLKNGSKVCSVMKISNIDDKGNNIEDVFKIYGGENDDDILVSGSHLIYDPIISEFVQVKDLKGSSPSVKTEIKCDEFACLITSDHTIPIGKWIFHDWEDNNGSASKSLV